MATVTPPKTPLSRAESANRVASPLQQLRGIIRMYVTCEGVAAAVLYLAVCFWLGLALDYGIFKITGLDWIQILTWGFRGFVLFVAVVALIGLVAYMVVSRLITEFRPAALALVLERRFPKLLGDRLITAVELADTKKAATYGYSQQMIEHTIREAADLIGKAPVKDVFNWRRLIRYGIVTLALTVGAYILLGVVYCGVDAAVRAATASPDAPPPEPETPITYAQRFNQVSGIWFERNILLRDVPWPRRAMLVVQDFDEDERRIGRDSPPVAVTVQAFKWVVADPSKKQEGWRPMLWTDLPDYIHSAPTLAEAGIPDRLNDPRYGGVTVDDVDAFLLDSANSEGFGPARETIAKLETLAASIPMQRKIRKLEIPGEVRLYYKGTGRGTSINSMQAMEPSANRRFMATLPELKEDIKFWATGADYSTPRKAIRVVPPPELNQLTRDEWQPAYLHYRVLGRSASTVALKGKRQMIRNQPVSLSGDTCRLDVPFGTDLELTGRLSVFEDQKNTEDGIALKPMTAIRIKPTGGVKEDHKIDIVDARTFKVMFKNITSTLDFAFEFVDENNVTGFRHVVIKPVDDTPPEVEVQVEVVRKTNNGYLITPLARVPFSGKVKDDRGIAHAEYGYSLARLDAQPGPAQIAFLITKIVGWTGNGLPPAVAGLAREQVTGRSEEQDSPPAPAPLRTFDAIAGDKDRFAVAAGALDALLKGTPADRSTREQRFLKEYTLHPDEEYFDVEKLGLKPTEENAPQPKFRLRIWVQAQDTNVETGPNHGQSKEKFTLLIVSENELLNEIGKEEEGLNGKLEDAVNKLKDARIKLEKVMLDLPGLTDEEMKPVSRWTVDTGEVGETTTKVGDVAREVLSDYRRILAELKANRVQKGWIDRVGDKIVEPLTSAGEQDFPRTEESIRVFLKNLKAGKKDMEGAQRAMRDLSNTLDRLSAVLAAMEGQITLHKLVAQLVEIEKNEAAAAEAIKKKYDEEVRKLLGDITEPEKKPEEKKK